VEVVMVAMRGDALQRASARARQRKGDLD